MSGYVTLRDIVKCTGLSIATVSRALRDMPGISAATRTVVQQAARELGYRVDPVLAALSAHRWHRRPVAAGSALAALADGILDGDGGMAQRAATYGYRFEVFQIHDYPDPRRLADVLYARGIQGLIVGHIHTPGFCAAFDWSRFTAVACNEGVERPPVHLVMPNHFRAVQQAWDWAWDRGFRRIGLASFDMPSAIDLHDRRAAFLDRQQRVPVLAVKPWRGPRAAANKPERILHSEAIQCARAWMQRDRPEIVLGFNAIFRWLLHDAGWRAPRWQAFVDLWISDPAAAATGTRLDGFELGRRAVDWVDSLLRSGERGIPRHPSTTSIDFEWQDGAAPPSPVRRSKAGKPKKVFRL
jgi:LacI family transcriptional regulator